MIIWEVAKHIGGCIVVTVMFAGILLVIVAFVDALIERIQGK